MVAAANQDIIIRVEAEVDKALKNLRKIETRIGGMKNPKSFKQLDKALQGVERAERRLQKITGKNPLPFQGWAMSIMFFGMALQRAFSTIWKSSTQTFQDVMHSVEGTVTRFDVLNGSVKYLQFVAGQALEPLVGFIIPIIDILTEWISNNEELFRWTVALGSIIGTTFAIGGMAYLALFGFLDLMKLLGLATVSTSGTFMGFNLGAFGAFLTNPVVLAVTAAIIALSAISWKAFKETPAAWNAMKDAFKQTGSSMGSLVKDIEKLIQTVFPEFQISWETIAWTIAWVGKIVALNMGLIIDAIRLVVNVLTSMIEGFGFVAEAAKAMWAAIRGGFGGANFESLKQQAVELSNALVNVKSTADDLMSNRTEWATTLAGGPMGMKERYEQQTANEAQWVKNEVYIDRIDMWGGEDLDNAEKINRLFQTVLQDMNKAR
jgi:hypothetical protein